MLNAIAVSSCVLAFAVPFLLAVWWPCRRWKFWIVMVGVLLSGWSLVLSGALLLKHTHDAKMYERLSIGLPVADTELLNDGVGENALALVFGWIVPASGAGLGVVVAAFLGRRTQASTSIVDGFQHHGKLGS